MYVLVLIFVNAVTHTPVPGAHVMPYTTKDLCSVAGPDYARYEAGVEQGKALAVGQAQPDEVYWYCVPVMHDTQPTT